jgi:hypothetical protein
MKRKYEITWSDKAMFPNAYGKVHTFKVDAYSLNEAWIEFIRYNQLDEEVHQLHIWIEPMSSYQIRKGQNEKKLLARYGQQTSSR